MGFGKWPHLPLTFAAIKHNNALQVLYLYCKDKVDLAPDHPIMRPGIVVSIGLDKTTKLSAVFNRYVAFCNLSAEGSDNEVIDREDLEFVHCQLLHGDDTAETSALMKNDRILVRKMQVEEREITAERKRLEREADRSYFQQMRNLMPDLAGFRVADVILDCRGKLVDTDGRNQRVLSTTVRAHSSMVARRCPWLGNIIEKARIKAKQAMEGENVDGDEEEPTEATPRIKEGAAEIEDDLDGHSVKVKQEGGVSVAAKIEDDNFNGDEQGDSGRPSRVEEYTPDDVISSPPLRQNRIQREERMLLVVKVPNHSPEAIKLLLEYCYTNRVLALGHDAFVRSCKTKPSRHHGPVPPTAHLTARRWPSNGWPTISFHDALAGIAMAEEAGMARLSLMCEVAAAQLIDGTNVTEALTTCTKQKSISGNDLPRLRKAAMDVILGGGTRGVAEIGRSRAFRKALEEQRAVIVPTLLQGTMEAVAEHEKKGGLKRDASLMSASFALSMDKVDARKRESERRLRRQEREKSRNTRLVENGGDLYDPQLPGWAAETAKRSLKRMSHHLETINRTSKASRDTFHPSSSSTRRSNRRRTSQN